MTGSAPLLRSLLVTAGAVALLGAGVVWVAGGGPESAVATIGDVVAPDDVREVAVHVHAWGFSPKVIRVRPGERVRFVAVTDDIKHGLAINELDVNLQLVPGRAVRSPAVAVTLPEGTYAIHCSTFCGLGHPAMKGRLVVGTPRPPAGTRAPWLASLASVAAAAAFAAVVSLRRRRA